MSGSLVIRRKTVAERFSIISKSLFNESVGELPNPNDFESIDDYLNQLTFLVLDVKYSPVVVYCFKEIIYEIIARLVSDPSVFEQSYLKSKNVVEIQKHGILVLYALAKSIALFDHDRCASAIALIEMLLRDVIFLQDQDKMLSQLEINLILISFYRLLCHSHSFSKYVSLKVINLIINNSDSTPENKLLAIKILVKTLNYSTITQNKLISEQIGQVSYVGQFEAMDDFNYEFLDVYEGKRISNFLSLPCIENTEESQHDLTIQPENLSLHIRLVYGTLVPSIDNATRTASKEKLSINKFVPVESAVKSLTELTRKILVGKPVLLFGGNGSGKSLILNHLHRLIRGNDNDLVTIHLNDQTDIKLLLGTYVSSHEPGKFVWKDGVLTSAVKNGKWLVIEDIDSAKNEILSIFSSLVKSEELKINGNERVKIKNGFQLIATISVDDTDQLSKLLNSNSNIKGDNVLDVEQFNYWQQVLFENFEKPIYPADRKDILPDLISLNKFELVYHESPTPSDLLVILATKYKEISLALPNDLLWQKIISLFYYMRFKIFTKRSFIAMNNGLSLKKIDNFELIRLANRINLLFQNNHEALNNNVTVNDLMEKIFTEALDIFTSSLQNDTIKNFLINKIGLFLEIPASQIRLFTDIDSSNYQPELQVFDNEIHIGRNKLIINQINSNYQADSKKTLENFALTNHSLHLLEKLSISVNLVEPVLLSGETGCGKTTVVQNFAKLLKKKIVVLNLSQETESNDLIGGYKPILNKQKSIILPIHNNFLELFGQTFNLLKNEKFMKILNKEFKNEKFGNVIKLWKKAVGMAHDYINKQQEKLSSEDNQSNENDSSVSKKKRKLNDKLVLRQQWKDFEEEVLQFQIQFERSSSDANSLQFDFIEGSLVKAIKNGDWVLLDEINLASGETLENISDLLSNEPHNRRLLLTEKASTDSEKDEIAIAHPEFRLFACMNPSTDVGKKNLAENIRSRFNEIFVDSPDKNRNDLRSIVHKYLWNHLAGDDFSNNETIDDVVDLYYEVKALNDKNLLVDGSKNKIVVNIRILSRALVFSTDIARTYGVRRSLYEAFNMILLTLLDSSSEQILKPIIYKYTIGKAKNVKSIIKRIPPRPSHLSEDRVIQFAYYWLEKGEFNVVEQPHYIITPFVEKNLMNLVRATLSKRFPILIQGPTSSGKTSMITYLAKITGNKVIRINNHEHTDLQEYLGSYVSDSETGKLVFKHGPLIEALKKGYWIILDELNLASSEILEGINRLLDDNREIFLTETQELIKPHKNFLLFATQNPPGAVYGGRKFLSKAFKNRFLELNFDDIPQDELEIILCNRCQIPPSYAKKIVMVYKELTIQRSSNRIFETKNSFATLRDLFRWGSREAVGYEELATNGYMLLAEKNRKFEEKSIIRSVIEKVMKVKLDIDEIYSTKFDNVKDVLLDDKAKTEVVWTKEMKKLSVLIINALKNSENILLVGETGCGKTTVCNNLAKNFYNQNLVFLNAHQNIETGDIIGSQRPLRNRSKLQQTLRIEILKELSGIDYDVSATNDCDLNQLVEIYEEYRLAVKDSSEIEKLLKNLRVLFEWSDGPLVNAMKNGDIFLFDEISLAEDSVLERLNSVLEPEKTLYLTEYSNDIDQNLIVGKKGFQFLATMNPGGDYGKKELSPALRNRFTEIYVPSMSDFTDVALIVESKLNDSVKHFTESIISFSEWFSIKFSNNNSSSNNGVISIRDILAWVEFINNVHKKVGLEASLVGGVCMVFVDALGTNNTAYLASDITRLREIKEECVRKLSEFSKLELLDLYDQKVSVTATDDLLKIGLYDFPRGSATISSGSLSFNLLAPTTAINAMRVLRAMVIKKPILLEGDPGVGKSSLIDALAKATNNKLTRINLSDQTDLVDLFGSDAPMEGGNFGEFVWKDAPFLRAMKCGEWVLLDEMNLASPSLLEALNSVFDFRQRVYIPELDQEFECHKNFRVFAAQNPQYQGGGRKGLPKSFINRFTNVYIGKLTDVDMEMICHHIYPNIPEETINKLIRFVFDLEKEINIKKLWGMTGGPWEFNIRDIIKFLDVDSSNALDLVFAQKFRLEKDRKNVYSIYEKIFGTLPAKDSYFHMGPDFIQANTAVMKKEENTSFSIDSSLLPLQSNIPLIESIFTSIMKKFPVLLVGPTLGGKSDLVKYVANAIGARLETVHIHSEIDITDLVGGLDQYHISRELFPLIQGLEIFLKEFLASEVDLVKSYSICNFLDYLKYLSEFFSNHDEKEYDVKLDELLNNLNALTSNLELERLVAFGNDLKKLRESKSKQFQFFDGILVDALEKGYWLHLSNINLVNSSIVDRLNSLTENNGVLVVSESGSADGQPKVIKPHPNFRLFLSMNPKYGELSRAMRNRCAEIYVEAFDERATSLDRLFLGLDEKVDLPSTTESETIESSFSKLAVTRSHEWKKEKFSSYFISSKQYSARYLSMLLDVMNNASANLGIPDKVAYVVASFIPYGLFEEISDFVKFVDGCGIFNSSEKLLVMKLFKFLGFLKDISCIEDETPQSAFANALINSCEMSDVTKFASIKFLYGFFEFSEKFKVFVKSGIDEGSKRYLLVNEVFEFLKHSVTRKTSDVGYDILSTLCVCGTLAIDIKEPEKFNFIIEKIQSSLELLNSVDKSFSYSDLNALKSFEVLNSDSMTRLWNHFVLLPDLFEKLIKALPESWKSFIRIEYQNGRISGVSLDLNLFKKSQNIDMNSKGSFISVFNSLQKLIESSTTASGDFNITDASLMLSLKSGRDLVSLTDSYIGKLVKPYPVALNNIYSESSLGSIPFVEATFERLFDLDNVTGADIKDSIMDVKYLFGEIVKNSNIVITDQLSYYKKILSLWLKEVIMSQIIELPDLVEILESVWKGQAQLELLFSKMKKNSKLSKLLMTFEKYFMPSFMIVFEDNLSYDKLGKAFIFFSTGLIQLFIPSAPYDPAICEFILYDIFTIKKQDSDDYKAAIETIKRILSGDQRIFFEGNHEEEFEKIPKPRVERPQGESIKNLFDEWSSFMDSSVGSMAVERLLGALNTDLKSNKISLLHKSSERFLFNLAENFTDYMDLNLIFKGGILGLNFGFSLCNMEHTSNIKSDALSSLTSFSEFFSSNRDACTALRSFGFFFNEKMNNDAFLDTLNSILFESFAKWKTERTKKEAEEKEASNVYKFKGEEEEDPENAYQSYFPDYDDENSILADEVQYFNPGDGPFVSTVFSNVFMSRSDTTISDIVDVINEKSFSSSKKSGTATPSMVSSLLNKMWKVVENHESQSLQSTDFYFKPNIYQFNKCLSIVDDIRTEVLRLLEQWPENATLINIGTACNELRTYKSTTTLARLITKMEQILKFLDELVQYSSNLDKKLMQSFIGRVTSLIVSWRQIELGSFNNLINNEHELIEKKLVDSYYLLFELLVVSYASGEKQIEEIVSLLNMFMSNSTQGEFEGKLNLLKAFDVYIQLSFKMETDLLQNIISFYEQFLPSIKTCLEETVSKLTKDINEVILLASWKDVNIDALKESSRKSKRSLYKVVKKYRTALSINVRPIIESGLDYQLSQIEFICQPTKKMETTQLALANDIWLNQPKLLLNLSSFLPKVSVLHNELECEEFPELLEFCKSILGEMDRLRKATPKEMNDDNKKIVSALKTEKRLLLSSTIKDLKNMGLKTQEIQKYKLTAISILAKGDAFEEVDDNIFFRVLDLLPRLRNSVAECAEDVPKEDAAKGLAITENLIFSLFSLRKPMKQLLSYKKKLTDNIRILEAFALQVNDDVVKPSNLISSKEKALIFISKFLPKLIDFALETIQRSTKMLKFIVSSDVLSFLNSARSSFIEFESSYDPSLILTVSKLNLLSEFENRLNDFSVNLREVCGKTPELSFIFELLDNCTKEGVKYSVSDEKELNIHAFDIVLEGAIDLSKSITVAMQKIKQLQSEEIDVDTEKYFIKTQQRFVSYKNLLYLDQIVGKMDSLISKISNSNHEGTFVSVIQYYLPLINEYNNFTYTIAKRYVDNYVDVSKSTYILATALSRLATNGFCSPQNSSEQDEQTESGSGGGLGDGIAADSKTNDDVDEDDLDEDDFTANKDDEDEKDDGMDDNEEDKAIDIEGDMEGQNEDMEAQDDEEKDEGDAEDLDEEVDDLDDLDPNAVDDKMWDEETQDDKKEKDSNNMPDDSKPDSNDLEAMDEDNEASEGKNNEDPNNEDGDDDENNENDDEADEEEDVGQQDDEVVQDENEQLEDTVPETEALELPEDLNLDNGEEKNDEEEDEANGDEDFDMDNDLDQAIDMEEEKKEENINEGDENIDEDMQENQDEEMKGDLGEDDLNDEEDEEIGEEIGEGEDDEENDDNKDGDEDIENPDLDTEMAEDNESKKNDEAGEDNADENAVDAIESNIDENNENIDTEASAKQASGEEREGDQDFADNANTAGSVGDFHSQSDSKKNEDKSQKEQQKEKNDERLKESLKQLGDSLNEFYKRSEEILDSNEVSDETEIENAAENPDQLQHLDKDDDDNLQALGNAEKDQLQTIDEDKMIEEKEEDKAEDGSAEDDAAGKDDDNTSLLEDRDSETLKENDDQIAMDEDLEMNKADNEKHQDDLEREQEKDDSAEIELDDDESIEQDSEEIDNGDGQDEYGSSNIVDLEKCGADIIPPVDYEGANELWKQSEFATNELAMLLCEQLRLILSPTISTKLKGDYKNGKRLNLKKIISYIASDFKKDKIWLKRTKPSKRNYQIMISIDDSKSMSENPQTVKLTYDTISLVSKALTQLESGDLSIVKFGKDTSIIHNFNKKFDAKSDGPKCFQWFGFDDTVTNMKDLVENSIEIFNRNGNASSNTDLYKLEIIISDGICENHSEISRLVRRAKEEKLLIVFVIIDGLNKNKESITDMSQVKYETDESGNMDMKINKYLDTFPFENYTIVDNITELPEMICQILRTFFMSSV